MPFDVRNLENTSLFKLFWRTHNDPDLSGEGLNELTVAGADKLADHALAYEMDGIESPPDRRIIGEDERAIIRAILEHPHYGAFVEQDARSRLIARFGLPADQIHLSPNVVHPKDEGDLVLGDRASLIRPEQLANVDPRGLPQLFAQEYLERRGHFEEMRAAPEERSRRILALFRDYSRALWARGENEGTEAVGHGLLDALERTRSGALLASKNFNAAPWSAAQSLTLGMDPNVFVAKFPEAARTAEATYLSMNDGMAAAMGYVDQYLEARGLPKRAEEYERKSPLNWLVGEEAGHLKRGNLEEKRPFATSGVNWGVALFPNDPEIRALPPKAGFELPIDCLDAFGNFITVNPKRGERINVVDERGRPLRVEKQIERDAGGKAVSWSARFYDGANEVPAEKALGVMVDARGRTKGDGKAGGSVNMWWWGFCDRNTAQQLYKSKFKIPQLEREQINVKVNDKVISFPRAEAQKLIDMDIPDIVTGENMCGFRFNDEPQQVSLKSGQRFMARVAPELFESGAALTRLSGDMVAVHDGPGRPMLGVLEVKGANGQSETIPVKDLVSLTKDEATGKVTLKLKNQYRDSLEGELLTEVPWQKAARDGGKLVLEQGADYPVRGAIKLQLDDGSSKLVAASEISQIVGEMQKDLRFSQFLAWVSRNNGMFATDSSTGTVVSNGMRWVNKFDSDVREGDERPQWLGNNELVGIQGPLARQPGDRIVFTRALYANQQNGEPNNVAFSGWVHLSKSGRIVNEGFVNGQPDFGWSADGPLDWTRPSTFNPYMSPELRVALLVNGLKARGDELDKIAQRLNLPANYRDYLTPQAGD